MKFNNFCTATIGENKITKFPLKTMFMKTSDFIELYEDDRNTLYENFIKKYDELYLESESFENLLKETSANKIKLNFQVNNPLTSIYNNIKDIEKEQPSVNFDDEKFITLIYLQEDKVNNAEVNVEEKNINLATGLPVEVATLFVNIKCKLSATSFPFEELYDEVSKDQSEFLKSR